MMKKTIKIGNKEVEIKSSAFTMFSYQNKYGRDLLEDMMLIKDKIFGIKEQNNSDEQVRNIMPIIKIVFNLCYTMAEEADPSIKEQSEWLKEFDNIFEDNAWINDVIEVGMSPFRRTVQKT